MKKIVPVMAFMVLLLVGLASAEVLTPTSQNLPPPWLGANAYDGDNDTSTDWRPADLDLDLTYDLASYLGETLTVKVIWEGESIQEASPTAELDCEGNSLLTQQWESVGYDYLFSKRTTDAVEIPQACLIDGAVFTFSIDTSDYVRLNVYEIFVETPSCVPNWSCSGYADCVDDSLVCNAVTDLNACGESYAGNYSEFESMECPTVVEGTGSGFAKRPDVVDVPVVEGDVDDDVVVEQGLWERFVAWLRGLLK